jgi:cytochrome c-type biogenesis protein CcmH/NrfG
MTPKRIPKDDPVVLQVRAIRQRLWKQAGGTFDGLLKLLDRTVPKRSRTRRTRRRRARVSGT